MMSFKKTLCLASIVISFSANGLVDVDSLHTITKIDNETIIQAIQFLSALESEAESNWKKYYHVFPNLITKYNLKKGVEIGVSTGGHSFEILKTTSVEKLYSIDPYVPNTTLNLWVSDHYYYDILYNRVKDRLSEFGARSELIRAYSEQVISFFRNGEIDFVFIDGSHEYEDVKNDLTLYYDKVRSGGIIAGDDYNTGFPGVPAAVNEFCELQQLTLNIDFEQPRIWWVQKP